MMSSALVEEPDSILINWKSVPAYSKGAYEWSRYHHMWLRDNCQCKECFNTEWVERLVHSKMRPLTIYKKPTSINFDEAGGLLRIVWEDEHVSPFSFDWLMRHAYEYNEIQLPKISFFSSVSCRDRTIEPVVFSKELGTDPPTFDYRSFLENEDVYFDWSDQFERYGFSFITNCPLDAAAQRTLLERVGHLRRPFWEDYYELGGTEKDQRGHADSSYGPVNLEMHTDGVYLENAPGIQLLHVFEFEGSTWADNLLVDGVKLIETIKKENPCHYQILTSVPIPFINADKYMNYVTSHPVIVLDPETGGFLRINFRDTNLSPFDKKTMDALKKVNPEATMSDLYAALITFTKRFSDKDMQYRFTLKPGTALFTDNFRMMHGRTPYVGRRVIRGFITNIEDWRAVLKARREKMK